MIKFFKICQYPEQYLNDLKFNQSYEPFYEKWLAFYKSKKYLTDDEAYEHYNMFYAVEIFYGGTIKQLSVNEFCENNFDVYATANLYGEVKRQMWCVTNKNDAIKLKLMVGQSKSGIITKEDGHWCYNDY